LWENVGHSRLRRAWARAPGGAEGRGRRAAAHPGAKENWEPHHGGERASRGQKDGGGGVAAAGQRQEACSEWEKRRATRAGAGGHRRE